MLKASATKAVNWYSFHPSFSAALQWVGGQSFCRQLLDQSVLSFMSAVDTKCWAGDGHLEEHRPWSYTGASPALNQSLLWLCLGIDECCQTQRWNWDHFPFPASIEMLGPDQLLTWTSNSAQTPVGASTAASCVSPAVISRRNLH